MEKKIAIGIHLIVCATMLRVDCYAVTLFVSPDGDSSDGMSWRTALTSISDAILMSVTNDEIRVRSGQYSEHVTVTHPLLLVGGFSATDDKDVRPTSVINGNGTGSALTILGDAQVRRFVITRGNADRGAGIFIRDSTVELFDLSIAENGSKQGTSRGGGLFVERSRILIFNCEFIDNTSSVSGGGIVLTSESDARILQSTFRRNISETQGGGVSISGSYAVIKSCVFEDNRVIQPSVIGGFQKGIRNTYGGAAHIQSSFVTMCNCLFRKNVARTGGAIMFRDGQNNGLELINCTLNISDLVSNVGIAWNNGSPKIENCIVTGKEREVLSTSNANVTYSLVEGGYPGEGNIDTNPLFVDPDHGDYHLQRGSPCIDSGTDTGLMEDFDGNDRPVGDYDMGAFEFPFLRSDIDGSGKVDSGDLLIFQEDWKKESGS